MTYLISRQVSRAVARVEEKARVSRSKVEQRRDGSRALLRRQSQREKAGAYDGRLPVAALVAYGANKTPAAKRVIRKGRPYGRVLANGYHVTKGWRAA